MLDVHGMILLYDMVAQTAVDDRLALIADNNPSAAITTERTVYARDPLKSISDDLDMLKIVPTIPPSNQVQALTGKFYNRGVLYVFTGATSASFLMPRNDEIFVFIGYKVDRIRNTVSLYVSEDYGTLSEFHPEVVPAATVRIRADATSILSSDIVNLLPYYNFDTTHPGDRLEYHIPCIPPGATVTIDRRPFYKHDLPLLNIYQVTGVQNVEHVVHLYDSEDTADDVLSVEPTFQYLPVHGGLGIKRQVTRNPIRLLANPDTLFVSAHNGLDINSGTRYAPMQTIEKAIELFNADDKYTTLYLDEGQYVIQNTITVSRDITIVGHSTDKTHINMVRPFVQFDFQGSNTTIRTVLFRDAVGMPMTASQLIKCAQYLNLYNCVFRCVEGLMRHPLISTIDLFVSNCVFHNTDLNHSSSLWSSFPSGTIGMQNLVICGLWNTPFQRSTYNIKTTLDGANQLFVDPIRYNYLPKAHGGLYDTGTSNQVGLDLDGSQTDIGVYGGKYASMMPIEKYPVNKPVVFRYALPTMYTPVIGSIHSVVLVGDMPDDTQIYGAVSFNGGGTWLKWDVNIAAWREIDISQIHIVGNTHIELIHRLTTYAAIVPSGELVFAWGMCTSNPNVTPIIKKVDIRYKTKQTSYTYLDMTKVTVNINEFAILLKNVTTQQLRNIVVVAG